MYGHHIWQSMDQPGKVADLSRGQLDRENEHFLVPVGTREFGLARRVGSAVPWGSTDYRRKTLGGIILHDIVKKNLDLRCGRELGEIIAIRYKL